MSDYSIYCTEEQTKKALELGAPINLRWLYESIPFRKEINIEYGHYAEIPTAEEMVGWLEDQGINELHLVHVKDGWMTCIFLKNDIIPDEFTYKSRKEAILAAIDAALGYLIKNKNLTHYNNQK